MGVALGALFGGKLINKIGRKWTIIISNFAIILFSCLSLIPMFFLVVVMRFLFGVTVGFLLAAAPKIVLETVPAHLLTYGFGSFANIFTFFFVSIVVAVNLIETTVMSKYGYIFIYLLPVPFTLVANIGLFFFYPRDTATHIIENHNCKRCDTHRCLTCKVHIKENLHAGVSMMEDEMEKAYQ